MLTSIIATGHLITPPTRGEIIHCTVKPAQNKSSGVFQGYALVTQVDMNVSPIGPFVEVIVQIRGETPVSMNWKIIRWTPGHGPVLLSALDVDDTFVFVDVPNPDASLVMRLCAKSGPKYAVALAVESGLPDRMSGTQFASPDALVRRAILPRNVAT